MIEMMKTAHHALTAGRLWGANHRQVGLHRPGRCLGLVQIREAVLLYRSMVRSQVSVPLGQSKRFWAALRPLGGFLRVLRTSSTPGDCLAFACAACEGTLGRFRVSTASNSPPVAGHQLTLDQDAPVYQQGILRVS